MTLIGNLFGKTIRKMNEKIMPTLVGAVRKIKVGQVFSVAGIESNEKNGLYKFDKPEYIAKRTKR